MVGTGLCAATAEAGPGHRHHHHRPHFVSRVVVFAPIYAVPRYYYPAPVYYAPPPPPVYIEQPQPAPQSAAYWYYCPAVRQYYPHVPSCPGGWQRVAPQPPPG